MDVIRFLNEHGLVKLEERIVCRHEKHLDVYILNYGKSLFLDKNAKRDPIACQCRSLIVRQGQNKTWQVMARSFVRFFNYGEHKETDQLINENIAKCTVYEKKDGSLITVTNLDGTWRVFTRGTDADANPFRVYFHRENDTKDDAKVEETFGSNVRKYLELAKLDPNLTYVFELCTPGANITNYTTQHICLLTVVNKTTDTELGDQEADAIALENKWPRPESFRVASMQTLAENLKQRSRDFEGFVIRFGDLRVKFKSDSYKQLHLLGSSPTDKRLIRAILQDEGDELTTIKTFAEKIPAIRTKIDELLKSLQAILDKYKDKQTKKDFALAIKDEQHPLKFLLFPLRDGKIRRETMFQDETVLNKVVDIVEKLM